MHSIRDRIRTRRGITRARLPGPLRLRGPLTATFMATGLVIALSASAVARTAAPATGRAAYLNASVPIQARVGDLLGRMTLPEKIGQMVQI